MGHTSNVAAGVTGVKMTPVSGGGTEVPSA